jgi:hypothetical protein
MLKERGDSMAINDNTTGSGSSFSADSPRITARDFDDYTAKSISETIARTNYKKSFKSDFKVAELRKYVYKMVTSWSESDKKAILTQYGSSDALKGGKLDEAVTETLIINLKESDLQIILNDIRGDEATLGKKVREIRQVKRRQASRFSTKTFNEVFEGVKNIKKTKNITKELKKFDKGFKVPRNVRSAFPRLKKELLELIPLIYNRVELPLLASKMGIQVEEGTKEKDVINMIVNKTLLYVALITGKTKATFSGAILDPEPFKELLGYTTYSWAGGRPGISTIGLKDLRNQAILAKSSLSIQLSQRREKGIFADRKQRKLEKSADRSLKERIKSKDPAILKRQEELKEKSLFDLSQVGQSLGVSQKLSLKTKDKYISAILKKEEVADVREEQLENKAEKLLSKGKKLSLKDEAELSAIKDSKKSKLSSTFGTNIPYVKFKGTIDNENFKSIADFAVPVWVLNNEKFKKEEKKLTKEEQKQKDFEDNKKLFESIAGDENVTKDSNTTSKPQVNPLDIPTPIKDQNTTSTPQSGPLDVPTPIVNPDTPTVSNDNPFRFGRTYENGGLYWPPTPEIGPLDVPTPIVNPDTPTVTGGTYENNESAQTSTPQVNPANIVEKSLSGSFLDFIRAMGKKASESGVTPSPSPTAAAESAIAGPSEMDTKLDVMSRNAGREIGGKRNYAHFFELAKPFLPEGYTVELGKDGDVVKVLINGNYVKKAELAKIAEQGGVYSSKGGGTTISALAGIDISSLIDDNLKSKGYKTAKNEPVTPVYITNKSLPTDAGKLILGLARILLRILVPVGGGLIADQLDAMASGTGGIDQLLEMAGLATGGKGRAVGSLAKKTTHFISGDSLNKKPNPEQVSVNWANKSYTVKPIPQFAEGGGQSASGQITRMTSTERNKPMSVGISSHLVTYNRELQGASDNGDKQALKVYAVNPGITDMVDVNGSNVSLIGLVSDAVIRLSNIEGLLSVNNQQNDATIAATSAVAANINRLKSSSSGKGGMNPFAGGFPSDLDEILTGV